MLKQCCAVLVVLFLAFAVTSYAQDKEQKPMEKKGDKMEMTKAEKEMGPLKTLSCDPSCGFMIRSHSEKEIISMAKTHAKKVHNMSMTTEQAKGMIKTADEPAKQ